MTELERLTELLHECVHEVGIFSDMVYFAEYLLKHGVIVPPCNLGDKTYYISEENPDTGEDGLCVCVAGEISLIAKTKNGFFIYDDKSEHAEKMLIKANSKSAMLSKEEAEKALRKRKNETD